MSQSPPELSRQAIDNPQRQTAGDAQSTNNQDNVSLTQDHSSATAFSKFATEFANHQAAVVKGNTDKAIQSFVMLQTNHADNPAFQKYVVDIADHIDPSQDTHISRFFSSLPALLQSSVIEGATDYLEGSDTLRSFQILFDYIQAYPRHAYKYIVRAIKLLLLYAQSVPHEDTNACVKLLVTELLPRLWKQRVLLGRGDIQSSIRSTDSKHYIVLSYKLFEQYLLIGQQYYIEQRNWAELNKFTCGMLDCCGYNGLSRLNGSAHIDRFQLMKDHRSRIRLHIEDDAENASLTSGQNKVLTDALRSSVAMMCEFMAAAVEFIQFSREYYTSVCGLDKDGSSPDEKTCLIPICAIQSPVASMQINQDSSTATEEVGRKRSHSVTSAKSDDDQHGAISGTSSKHFGLMAMERERCLTEITARQNKRMKCDIPDRGEGLNAYCMRGVDDVLQILSKAADCMRHIVDLCQWASVTSAKRVSSDWEEAFCKLIDQYKLPFDIYNAVLLTRSDLSLSSPSMPGNLAKALRLSQTICDRIELQRRRDKKENISRSPELDIPFMFAFRVLYNIGVIYLLVGSLQQSTLEIAIILSVFPIPIGLSEKDFIADEADCYTAAKIFQGHDFGMMRVTQEGLVVRCIKHLIVSLDSESGQQGGMASIDSAMRWDEKAGNMIVLMQFGWPYWNARTNFWEKIISRMKERRVFKNRGFLEYVYVPEILQVIRGLHESGEVLLDIIPPEFTMRGGYRHLMEAPTAAAPAKPSACTITEKSTTASHSQEDIKDDQADDNQNLIQKSCSTSTWNTAPCQESSVLTPLPRSTSEPSSTHATGPNTPMSPSWYSTSTRKSPVADWMSPSFCYSRPVMSNMLSKRDPSGENVMEELQPGSEVYHRPLLRKEIVTRCLDYRMQKYSPKMTPTRMRHVLQKFLKNMVLKANEET